LAIHFWKALGAYPKSGGGDKIVEFDALILAAGKGERLRPLSNVVPKPALPFLGFPILDFCLHKVSSLKPRRIFVNGHHLAGEVERVVVAWKRFQKESGPELIFFREPSLLGTGGTIRYVFEKFHPKNLLIHNGDLIHDIHVLHVLNHLGGGDIGCLLLTDNHTPSTTPVYTLNNHIVSFGGTAPSHSTAHTFSGIYVLNENIGRYFPTNESFSIIDSLTSALADGWQLAACTTGGRRWFDLGTRQSWLSAQMECLSQWTTMASISFEELARIKKSKYFHVSAGDFHQMDGVKLIGPTLLVDSTISGHGTIGPNVCVSGLDLLLEGSLENTSLHGDGSRFVGSSKHESIMLVRHEAVLSSLNMSSQPV
jgi:NDP-sugar pyrophosphorylase family protein